jgi:hypothetical protein
MRPEERMARTTDPSTSHEAAEKKAPRRASDYAVILGTLVITRNYPMTASEIDREHGHQGLSVSPAHKRLPELARQGLVVRCEPRVCSVTGYKAATWRIKR